MDSAIHWINPYPLDNSIGFAGVYPLDSELPGGKRHPPLEQARPEDLLNGNVRGRETFCTRAHSCCLVSHFLYISRVQFRIKTISSDILKVLKTVRVIRPVPNVVLLPCRTEMKLSFRFKHGSSTPFETIKRGTADLGSARLLSTAGLAVPHGSSTTWFQTACCCYTELNS